MQQGILNKKKVNNYAQITTYKLFRCRLILKYLAIANLKKSLLPL